MVKKKKQPDFIPIEASALNPEAIKHSLMVEPLYRNPNLAWVMDAVLACAKANVETKMRLQKQAPEGGKATAAERKISTDQRHREIICVANSMLSAGKPRRDLAAALAGRFQLSTRQIRSILKKGGVKKNGSPP